MLISVVTMWCSGRREMEEQSTVQEEEVIENPVVDRDDGGPPHPAVATAWYTRALVSTAKLPETEFVASCREDIHAIGAASLNHDAMVEAEKQIKTLIQGKLEAYHWCFYVSMLHLDLLLATSREQIDAVAGKFLSNMRDMWILARALDRERGGTKYFTYLKSRYIQLSQDFFGRPLKSIGPPIVDMTTRDKANNLPASSKEAGPAPIE
jgi:hypothetical protein